jgi:hypothetical protein
VRHRIRCGTGFGAAQDIEAAKKLLADAGFRNGLTEDIWVCHNILNC